MAKKIFLLFTLFIFFGLFNKGYCVTFKDAISQSKPSAVLIYADWADNAQAVRETFDAIGQEYAGKYNFVVVDIAKPEAKELNSRFYIYPGIPYVMLFRESGKVSRYIKNNTVIDTNEFKEKLNQFMN